MRQFDIFFWSRWPNKIFQIKNCFGQLWCQSNNWAGYRKENFCLTSVLCQLRKAKSWLNHFTTLINTITQTTHTCFSLVLTNTIKMSSISITNKGFWMWPSSTGAMPPKTKWEKSKSYLILSIYSKL